MIAEKGFIQVTRRCAVRQHDEPNQMLWDVIYDAKVWGRITIWKGSVNIAYGVLPPGIKLSEIKQALSEAGQIDLPTKPT